MDEASPWSEGQTQPLEIHRKYLSMNNAELLAYIKGFCPELTQSLCAQLERLDEPAIEVQLKYQANPDLATSSDYEHTHLGYELEMIRIVLMYQEFIQDFLFAHNDTPISFGEFTITQSELIRRLVYMIMLSDIGKAGAHLLSDDDTTPIRRIYTHVIMDQRHSDWLKQLPADFYTPELNQALGVVDSSPDLAKQVFQAGNFTLAPIRLAMYAAEQVFAQTYPNQVAAYGQLFRLDAETQAVFEEFGFDADSTAMKDFWTYAHLLAAENFFQTEVAEVDRGIAMVALLHHFSQGAGPSQRVRLDLSDVRALKLVALTEILDKVDANCHRSHQTNIEAIMTITRNMIMPNLHRNYASEHPVIDAYEQALAFWENTRSLQVLLRTTTHSD